MCNSVIDAAFVIACLNIAGVQQTPDAPTKPFTIHVVEADSGKPVTEFSYCLRIEAPDKPRDRGLDNWVRHQSKAGALEFATPISCAISIGVKAAGYRCAPGDHWYLLPVKSTDTERKFTIKLWRGITVTGIVRDADTKQPLANAQVMPCYVHHHGIDGDRDYAVTTDDQGRFKLHGVDWGAGIEVQHADYYTWQLDYSERSKIVEKKDAVEQEVLLRKGESLRGKVTTQDGRPLQGVRVSDSSGKTAQTDKNGAFVLRSPSRSFDGEQIYLTIEKTGYIRRTLHSKFTDPASLTFVLQACFELRGQVLDATGKPVLKYQVMAGPSRNPAGYDIEKSNITDGSKGFQLALQNDGEHWVGVRADGFAPWEGWIDVSRKSEVLAITLKPGVKVTGKVKLPLGAGGPIEAILIPQRQDAREFVVSTTPARELATIRTRLAADGSFTFPHVRPDDYVISLSGKGVTPLRQALTVPDAGLTVGTIEAQGTGRIVGQVFTALKDKKGPRPFASVSFRWNKIKDPNVDPTYVIADENGRFEFDDVPAGEATVSTPSDKPSYPIESHTRIVRVIAGQVTEVRFFDPSEKVSLSLDFVIGDGSHAQFQTATGLGAVRKVEGVNFRAAPFDGIPTPTLYVALTPMTAKPIFVPPPGWHTLASHQQARTTLRDIPAGKYRLQVGYAVYIENIETPLYDKEIEISPDKRSFRIPLGAASVTGQVLWTRECRYLPKVMAVSKDGKGRFMSWCDHKGNFCVRYLPVGEYFLYAHDYNAGWCQMGAAKVNNDIVDIAVHKLQAGGTIAGVAPRSKSGHAADSIVAVDSHGFTIRAPDFASGKQEFEITNLWPDLWTVKLLSGERILSTTKVELRGTEKALCNLFGD